jgi:hypothetical protein
LPGSSTNSQTRSTLVIRPAEAPPW